MNRTVAIVLFAGGIAAGVLLSALVMRPSAVREPAEVPTAAHADEHADKSARRLPSGEVYIDPAMLQNLGVRSAAVEQRSITESIHTTGYVDYDQRRLSQVNARISGWIQKLYVSYVGQAVVRGQKLLEIYSPELMLTEQDYLRARRLESEGVKEGPTTQDEGHDLMAAAEDRLRLWGIPPSEMKRLKAQGHASETVPLEATASGVVTEIKAVEGAHVKAGDSLYTIADLSRVWVYADVYERELPQVKLGQPAAVTSDALAGQIRNGFVSYIYPAVNEQTRTVRVRLEFANPHGELKPGMYVKATLIDETPESTLAVPTEAVLNSGLRRIVILDLGDGHFRPREIKVGNEIGGYFAVHSGLRAGDRVVTSAQFLIDSESNLHEALSAMAPGETPTAAPRGASAPPR
jgi:multidrug efflux pump subunit AcrA (membrane-fusion protein)